ncbi:MAG: hypothetical protein JNL98_23020 [Bryobacterales bacterium]|nr:hypothetical protein [Bryobacterales bacterium]
MTRAIAWFVISCIPIFPQSPPQISLIAPEWNETHIRVEVHPPPAPGTRAHFFAFVPDAGWYSVDCGGTLFTQSGIATAAFQIVDVEVQATRFAVYLLPPEVFPQCATGPAQIPASYESLAIGSRAVLRANPRPKLLRFSNYDWVVKGAWALASPGPSRFSRDHAFVDSQGRLHLRIARCALDPARFCTAEVFTRDALGHGTYRVTLDSPVDDLDPHAVLGLFTWSEDGAKSNRELDIEFTRWGNATGLNAQYVIQPYTLPDHLVRFAMPFTPSSVHTILWLPASVHFESAFSTEAAQPPIREYTFAQPQAIPDAGDAQFHINYYLMEGRLPVRLEDSEIIIRKFEHFPASPQTAAFQTLSAEIPAGGAAGRVGVSSPGAPCIWNAASHSDWLRLSSATLSGPGSVTYTASPNTSGRRTGLIQLSSSCGVAAGAQWFTVTQEGAGNCTYWLSPQGGLVSSRPGFLTFAGSAPRGCMHEASTDAPWVRLQRGVNYASAGAYTIAEFSQNPNPEPRTANLTIAGFPVSVVQMGASPAGQYFVPVAPCRVVDTRIGNGALGMPFLAAGSTRSFPVLASGCGIPAGAQAYSLNVTAVPRGPLPYVSLWPTGQPQPTVSTLNAFEGNVVANAAIVPAGAGGAVSVFAAGATDLVLDINGYFTSVVSPAASQFYPLLSPCRVLDTRLSGTPLRSGAPSLELPVRASGCPLPADARAYAVNFTVVPRGPLIYLTAWPSGGPAPLVSTLNSFEGRVLANAAIVPAGVNGAISIFAALAGNAEVDVIADISGYFGPRSPSGLLFYPVQPFRTLDTRASPHLAWAYDQTRVFAVSHSRDPFVRALSVNATAIPVNTGVNYLTLWQGPTGNPAPRPLASTLNSLDGRIVANAAILGVDWSGLATAYSSLTNPAGSVHLVLDVNGYFH